MDIKSLSNLKFNQSDEKYNLFRPDTLFIFIDELYQYKVQKTEEMRIDLVMMSIYDDNKYSLEDVDIILFLNGINNPLNINEGDIIYYPPYDSLQSYRFEFKSKEVGGDIRKKLAVPNKTTKKDPNRKKFTENYSLPPVVLDETKSPVRIEGDKIVIGGLN
jgi:phage pi2 protein 07